MEGTCSHGAHLARDRATDGPPAGHAAVRIVVESLRFNFRYVLEHGYRAFYQMTAEYLAKLAELLAAARQRLLAMDLSSVPFPPWELFTLDLNMIEVPAHCDSCRVVASYGEYALD